jgi:amino acid adenylation domain-containing protein
MECALHWRFLRGLAVSPDRAAVRVGAEELTYRRMHETALRWAAALADVGSPTVGVLASKGLVAYPAILAALYAGAAVVPLRPDFPVRRTREMLRASGAKAMIADAASAQVLAGLPDLSIPALVPDLAEDAELPVPRIRPHRHDSLDEPVVPRSEDPAYLLFTSGSTGQPKGVVLSHGNLRHYFDHVDGRYDFGPDDVFSQAFDLNFDCSVFDMFCAWGAGGTVQPIPPHAYRDLPGFLAEGEITVWFSTPSVIDLVRRLDGLNELAMPYLRWSLFAGEALKTRDAAGWQRAAPGSVLENLYGPTELTVTVAAYRWTGRRSEQVAVNGVCPIGMIHRGHDHLLLDDDGQPTATEGELCVAGPQLAPGYLDPQDERGRFFQRDGKRWYRTGDRVRSLADGGLGYLGRRDSQLQVQGWRVETAEVEHAMRACGVHDAVVVGVNTPAGTELAAFYTGAPIAPAELVRRLRDHLPDGTLPKHYRNVAEFPLNTNRKTDRRRLAVEAAELVAGPR